MTYRPRKKALQGLSYEKASCFGMPHFGATYRSKNVNSNQLNPGALCAFCHRPATNSHHEPPKSNGTLWLNGIPLKPALIALCGSGTTGCHGKRHARKITIKWEWKRDVYSILWWSGLFLAAGFKPHDPKLYQYGGWVFSWDK